MGYFLNIINQDLERLNKIHYINGNKPSVDEKIDYLKKFLQDTKIRYYKIDNLNETPNEKFFYFLTHVGDLSQSSINFNHDNLPFDNDLITTYRHNKFLFFIYVGEEKNYDILKTIFIKLNMDIDKLFLVNESNLNKVHLEYITGRKIKNVFNIVYDRWSEDSTIFYANLTPSKKDYFRYRVVQGLFRFYDFFDKIKNCVLDEVYENPDENYFYFVNGDNMNHHFQEEMTIPLPEKVKSCFFECNNLNIVFLNEHEYETEDFLLYLNDRFLNENYDCSRIYLFNNNSKLEYYREKNKLSYNVYSLDFLVKFISKHMVEFGTPNFVTEKSGDFFMCHNRSPKPHRYALLCMLKKVGLLNHTDWSLVMGWYHRKQNTHNYEHFLSEFFNNQEKLDYSEEIKFFNQIEIKKSKYEQEKTWFDDTGDNAHINWNKVYEYTTYEQTFFNIVTESCFSPKEIHITEKSVKPFYFYQFPIFLSSYNHVKYLRDRFGFDLYDDIINHDYDNETDNRIRLRKVYEEINRIFKNKKFFVHYYMNNKERFVKNHKIVLEINDSKRDVNFFKSLISKKL